MTPRETLRNEWRLWKLAASDREILKAEARAAGHCIVNYAFYSFIGVSVTSAVIVASMWPLDGVEWNGQTISEAYEFFRSAWLMVLLTCMAVVPFSYASPIAERVERLREYDKLSTRELLEIEARIKREMGE